MKKSDHNAKKLEKFRSQLQKNSLRATSQRLAVHEAMIELGHACAEDVCNWLSANSETPVTVASVYNTLAQMESIGIYQARSSSDSRMYFDVITGTHMHMYDSVNHKFRDLNDDDVMQEIAGMLGKRRFKGYNIDRIDIQYVVKPVKRKKLRKTSE